MTKEELQEINDQLQISLDAANKEILSLKQSLADANDLNEKLQESMVDIPAAAEVKAKPTIPEKSFKVDKAEYVFTVPQFSVPGTGKITSAEALTNPALLKDLVEMGFGGIKRKGE